MAGWPKPRHGMQAGEPAGSHPPQLVIALIQAENGGALAERPASAASAWGGAGERRGSAGAITAERASATDTRYQCGPCCGGLPTAPAGHPVAGASFLNVFSRVGRSRRCLRNAPFLFYAVRRQLPGLLTRRLPGRVSACRSFFSPWISTVMAPNFSRAACGRLAPAGFGYTIPGFGNAQPFGQLLMAQAVNSRISRILHSYGKDLADQR